MKGIIYKWTCNITDKSYIGQTVDEKRREQKFLNENSIYTKENSKIDIARKKYGSSKNIWKKEILKKLWCKEGNEKKLIERLNYWEKFYIKQYDTFNNGYNSTDGGNAKEISNEVKQILSIKSKQYHAKNNNHIKKEVSEKISLKNKNHKVDKKKCIAKTIYKIQVYKINKNTNEIIEKYDSIEEASRKNNINSTSIRCVCRGEKRKTAGGFIWKFCNEGKIKKEAKGYYFYKKLNRWKARVKNNKKDYTLGYFKKEETAKKIYLIAKEKIRNGEFEKWYDNIINEKYKIINECND